MRYKVIGMVLLVILEITLALYLTEWRHTFWNYVEQRNYIGFKTQLSIFIGVALVFCFISAYATYLGTLIAIEWRKKLTSKSLAVKSELENVNQRIQEDCKEYPILMIDLVFGVLKAFIYVLVFSIFLVYQFSFSYLIWLLLYAVISSFLIKRIAKPLIALNYKSQQVEATFRNCLTELNFQNCVHIMFGLAKKTKHLQYSQEFYNQIGVIVPFLISAPAYFAGGFSLGALMQINSTMGTILDNSSYGINSFSMINRFLSCRKRLKEINII